LFIAPRARAIVSPAGRWRTRALALGLIFALPALVLGLRVSVAPVQAQARAAGEAAAREELAAVVASIDAGRFEQARAQIDAALQQRGLDDGARAALEFQRERMRR
ncbi:hypothetical protein JTP77_044000, partial [Streptomyces sp. S9]|nr:hypothetical protein [Streptomyces sp. S9]